MFHVKFTKKFVATTWGVDASAESFKTGILLANAKNDANQFVRRCNKC